jgi:ribosomal-protein-alanine N-acetyltransferase
MTSIIQVRRAGAGESLSAVAALQAESFYRPWGIDAIERELRANPVARLYLIESVPGRLLGFCACWVLVGELHINSLAIRPDARRQGHARTLLRAVFAQAATDGARAATLEVRRSNTPAVSLYQSLGFAVEGVRKDYYEQPREDALVLWCRSLLPQPRTGGMVPRVTEGGPHG